MLLSDKDIKRALRQGTIVIKPRPNINVQLSSCSIDLRLGREFRVFQYSSVSYIDLKNKIPDNLTRKVKIRDKGPFILQPGDFVLASTHEWIELTDNIAARLEGRSSLGRIGIVVHATASLVHPGWRGNLVLELGNTARIPVALYPKMRICSLSFEYLTTRADRPAYKNKSSKYVGQKGAVGTKIDKEKI